MSKQAQTPETSHSKRTAPAQPAGVVENAETISLAGITNGLIGAASGDPLENQAATLSLSRFPLVQRQSLAQEIGRTQGNRHLQRVMSNRVQRKLPGGALVKVPYKYNWSKETNIGKYVKISKVDFTISGALEEMPRSSDTSERALETGGQTDSKDSKKDAVQIKLESKQAADDFFSKKVASLSENIKPYGKKAAGFSRSDQEATANVAYEHGFEMSPFIFQNTQFATAVEFNVVELKKEKGKAPSFEFLSMVPKVELSGKADNFPIDGMSANLKGEVAVTFEPDWVTLAMMALETPAGWVLAAVAGGLAIAYFSMKDIDRRQQLGAKIRAGSKAVIDKAQAYGTMVSKGEQLSGTASQRKGASQADTDLSVIVSKNEMTKETYFALVEADSLEKSYYLRAYSKYKEVAFANYEKKIFEEIEAWHDEHWIQSFFSGTYASDDKRAARAIIDETDRSEGQGFWKG